LENGKRRQEGDIEQAVGYNQRPNCSKVSEHYRKGVLVIGHGTIVREDILCTLCKRHLLMPDSSIKFLQNINRRLLCPM
jgi:hypothetical protein